ncbi:MAG TPA: hypothetical protein VGR21_08630 [Cryptosporangiaceae bacterium]|nr:hypothetical protein [Cryptosporangiaceae bacterium]
MSHDLNELVRDGLLDLQAEARSVDSDALVTGAIRRVARRRLAVAGGAAAVAVLVGGVAVTGGILRAPEEVRPADTTTVERAVPVTAPGGWSVVAVDARDSESRAVVLDRQRGRYRPLDYLEAVPSPDGRLVAATDVDGEPVLVDLASGQVRRIAMPQQMWYLHPRWAPDGSKVLFTASLGSEGVFAGFALLDPVTGSLRLTRVPINPLGGGQYFYHWQPDGRHVGAVVAGPAIGDRVNPIAALQTFSLDGKKSKKFTTITGNVDDAGRWSPDGRYVLVTPPFDVESSVQMVEVSTGRVVASFRYPAYNFWWIDRNRILVHNGPEPEPSGSNLIVLSADGAVRDVIVLPHVLSTGRLVLQRG